MVNATATNVVVVDELPEGFTADITSPETIDRFRTWY